MSSSAYGRVADLLAAMPLQLSQAMTATRRLVDDSPASGKALEAWSEDIYIRQGVKLLQSQPHHLPRAAGDTTSLEIPKMDEEYRNPTAKASHPSVPADVEGEALASMLEQTSRARDAFRRACVTRIESALLPDHHFSHLSRNFE